MKLGVPQRICSSNVAGRRATSGGRRRRRSRRDTPGSGRSGRATSATPATGHAPGDPRNIGWLYVLPGLLVYLLFTLAPLLHTVYYSLFSWDGLTAKTWVGLANYSEAIRDHILLISFEHSAILIVFYAVIPVMLGLLLTAALTRSAIRGFRFFRTTLYLPYLLAGVVIAQAWTWVYDASGPLNRGLELVGLGSLVRPWLGDFTWALPSIGVIGTWFTFGLCMVLFVAGVQKIPTSCTTRRASTAQAPSGSSSR